MEDLSWLIVLAGSILALVAIVDVFLTVLHVDTDGPLARMTFEVIWKVTMALVGVFPSYRRNLIALAGPAMIIFTMAVWMFLFIVGFALIYWPYLDLFRTEVQITYLDFIAALYFSGTTATVLGYGDITPMNGTLRLVAFLQSGIGFALLTGIITYLINVVTGVTDRNTLAFQLWSESGRTGNGTTAVIRSLRTEENDNAYLRMSLLLDSLYKVHQKMHQYPILDLFYRAKNPIYSPELMIKTAAEVSITAQVASSDKTYQRLLSVAIELDEAAVGIMDLLLSKNRTTVDSDWENPRPGEQDVESLMRVHKRLITELPHINIDKIENSDMILNLVCRLRIFLDEMDKLTKWRMDQQHLKD